MKSFYVTAILSIICLPCFANESSISKRIETLARESQQSKPACDAYATTLKQLVPEHESAKPLLNKADALKLLAHVRTYPGTPVSFQAALAEAKAEYLSKGELSKDVQNALMTIYGCSHFALNDTFRILIASAKPLRFSEKERSELAQALYDRIIRDLRSDDTMIAVRIYGDLVLALIEEHVSDASDAIFAELVRWNEQANLAQIRLKEGLRESSPKPGLDVQLAWPLRDSLVHLTKRLSEH